MEALVIYTLVLMAIGLMLVGAYGAMPIFVHHEGARPLTSAGPAVSLAGASPRAAPSAAEQAGRGPSHVLKTGAGRVNAATGDFAGTETLAATEAILVGLFNEVDLLRQEEEGLRGELSALIEVAKVQSPLPRRLRSQAGLPDGLREKVSSERRGRLAGA